MKRKSILPVLLIGFLMGAGGFANAQKGVAINSAGAAADSSAILDVSSVSKGALMPRMSTAQRDAIVNPAEGLWIFNTDCRVYNYNAGTAQNPNWATVNASNALIAGVSIAASPAGAVCAGTSVTFTATPASGISAPDYQWQVNGANVGSNSTNYTSAALNNGDVVSCILSSSAPCVSGSPATSNAITLTINPAPTTPGAISGNASTCANATGNVYSINPVSGATSYSWAVPGDATITAGAGTTSITVSFGSDSGTISVVAINSCGTSAASSQAINVNPPAPASPGAISGSANAAANSSGNVY